jgi:hypothetical protein
VAFGEVGLDDVRADEAGSASNQDPHSLPQRATSLGSSLGEARATANTRS